MSLHHVVFASLLETFLFLKITNEGKTNKFLDG
jgi:hypothetical protein